MPTISAAGEIVLTGIVLQESRAKGRYQRPVNDDDTSGAASAASVGLLLLSSVVLFSRPRCFFFFFLGDAGGDARAVVDT